jgi:transcriptional regulator with XRE-family HTH domain
MDEEQGVPGTPWALALRRARKRAGMTQMELHDASGVAQNVISRIESGKQRPRPGTLDRLALALGVRVDELDPRISAPLPDASWATTLPDRRFARHLKEASIAEILAALPLLNREAGAAMEQGDHEARKRAIRRFMDVSWEWQDRMGPLREAPRAKPPPTATSGEPVDRGEHEQETA